MQPVTTRITVPLGEDERDALVCSASNHFRRPRDQARYLLRLALGLDEPHEATAENSNSAGQVVTDPGAVVEANL